MSPSRSTVRLLPLAFVCLALLPGARPPVEPAPRGPPELTLSYAPIGEPGTIVSVELRLTEPLSLSTSRPVPNARVELRDGEAKLAEGLTDDAGRAVLAATLPASGKLAAAAPGTSARAELKFDAPSARLQLTTDKSRYQPGQAVHLRALALTAIGAAPLTGAPPPGCDERVGCPAQAEVVFEATDPQGNRLFRERRPLSRFGVGATSFPLAPETPLGRWSFAARVERGGVVLAQGARTVEVKRYELPNFRVTATPKAKQVRPGEPIELEVDARYFFGEPVAGRAVVRAGSAQTTVTLDAAGRAIARFDAPAEEGPLSIVAAVTDGAGREEAGGAQVDVAASGLSLALVAEGGALRPEGGAELYVVAARTDGASMSGKVLVELGGRRHAVTLDADGLGALDPGPLPATPQLTITATLTATDGAVATTRLAAPVEAGLVVRPLRSLPRAGEQLQVLVRGPGASLARLEAFREGQRIATARPAADGRALLELPAGVSGLIELHAASGARSGAAAILVRPARALEVSLASDAPSYLPGGEAEVTVRVTKEGRPVEAAVGLLALDEALLAIDPRSPGEARAFFALARKVATPGVLAYLRDFPSADELAREPADDPRRERQARLLLSAASGKRPPLRELDPAVVRREQAKARALELRARLVQLCRAGCLARDGASYRFEGGLPAALDRLVKAGALKAELAVDPFGGSWREEELVALEPGATPAAIAARHDAAALGGLWTELVHFAAVRPSRLDGGLPTLLRAAAAEPDGPRANDATGRPYEAAQLWRHSVFSDRELVRAANAMRAVPIVEVVSALSHERHRERWSAKEQAFRPPPGLLDEAVKRGLLRGNDAVDLWGTRFTYEVLQEALPDALDPRFRFVTFRSAGPDRAFGTADDLPVGHGAAWQRYRAWQAKLSDLDPEFVDVPGQWAFAHEAPPPGVVYGLERGFTAGGRYAYGVGGLGMYGTGMGGGGVAYGHGGLGAREKRGSASVVVGGPRVRSWFPETLLARPELQTGPDGTVRVRFPVADAITTFELHAVASDATGALGEARLPLRVFQEFFVEPELPAELTFGDELALPVALFNWLDRPQRVELTLTGSEGLQATGARSVVLELGPREVRAVRFPVKATRAGDATIELLAKGETRSDAVRRSVHVRPGGRAGAALVNGGVAGGLTLDVEVPAGAIPGSTALTATVWPGVVSQLSDGGAGLLRTPGGCMEQTSSSAYPNVLVARYLRRPGRGGAQAEALRKRADALVLDGTQRILRYQRPDGGFNWWGDDAPTNTILTALGLVQLAHARHVIELDERPLAAARARLQRAQKPDGSWEAEQHLHSWNASLGRDALVSTAFVTASLLEAGEQGPVVERGLDWLVAALPRASEDAYTLGLVADALARGRPRDEATQRALAEVSRRAEAHAKLPGRWLPSTGSSATGSGGESAGVEATALSISAIVAADGGAQLRGELVRHVVARRDGVGAFGSTQATALALRALLAVDDAKDAGSATLELRVDGALRETITLSPAEADLVRRVELGRFLGPGRHRVELRATGRTSAVGQLAARWALPEGAAPAVRPSKELALEVAFQTTTAKLGAKLPVRASLQWRGKGSAFQLTATLPVPPGSELDPDGLDRAVREGTIAAWRLHEGRIAVYSGVVPEGGRVELTYAVVPRTEGHVAAPGGALWAYYTPEERAVTQDVPLRFER